ncbi:sensor histidine kinase, partial [Klebsiella pneumoniae]|uniref:sensor histidine kinase n=1 Tax=Klebsiella pneumoniae TaxID=573 RepID=UPI00306AA92D
AVMKSLRATLRDLRPQEIDDLGLRAGLAALAATSERLSNGTLAITLETSGTLDELPPATSAHVYRIVQEGLANVVKHAGASRCSVTLR